MFLKNKILILITIFNINVNSQIKFYENIIKGGVCFAGFSTGLSHGSGTFDTYIEPGSFISKVYLFYESINSPNDIKIILDDINIPINAENVISEDFFLTQFTNLYKGSIFFKDITQYYQNIQSHFITIPEQINANCSQICSFRNFGIFIIYENENLNHLNVVLCFNNQNLNQIQNDYFISFNPININYPFGFSLYTDIINSPILNDGSYVFVENSNIGLIGGADNVNIQWEFGSRGHFYYQNNELFGLDDDTPDNLMNNSDALADISEYLINMNSLNWSMKWQNSGVHENVYTGFFLTYSTPCQPFDVQVSKDSTICPNSPLPLFASGGQSYTWLADGSSTKAAEVLSCTNCPNPVFTGDKSTLLTVQIWNNDSCSVVRPIKINVLPEPKFTPTIQISASDCGTSNGSILFSQVNNVSSFSIDTFSQTQVGEFTQLSSGFHSLKLYDEYNCFIDTIIFVPEQNLTQANYVYQPNIIKEEIEVYFDNQSTYATNYQWKINENVYTDLSSFTFDSSGLYNVTLYAWQYDESCIDSFSLKIKVYDNFSFSVPNIFTPNSDNKNDIFGINVSNEVEISYEIFNRWGNLVARGTNTGKGFVALWDGTTFPPLEGDKGGGKGSKGGSRDAIEGTYYYTLSIELKEELLLPDNPSSGILTKNDFPIKEKGWVQVVR
ncbi:MAG: gliding motility-associated C-terminal domain-containing protein [Flavobacteriia bacterium]|nr:gliding motility-associated C-terminal domain-containing protein [Flavobacteriia bacterium]